jgi:2-keto-4-pentenoate hydratase/2-oxohepta-3-ene-1,7-dioic acid hydratase in catechol pathway
MKIICVGRNYGEHAKELGNAVPEEPVIFCKSESAILKNGEDFYLPSFSNDVHHEVELVCKIGKMGKKIAEPFAMNYISEIGLGIDFTARDLQSKLKQKGLPWELAKGFDGSAVVGNFKPLSAFDMSHGIHFHLTKNGITTQTGNSLEMIFSFSKIVSFVSEYFTLKTGDLIFTGTPSGVSAVKIGDKLEGFIGDEKMFVCEVK